MGPVLSSLLSARRMVEIWWHYFNACYIQCRMSRMTPLDDRLLYMTLALRRHAASWRRAYYRLRRGV